MYASIVPLAVTFYFLFHPLVTSELGLFLWLVAFSNLSRTAMTLYHVPHLALGAEMTDDFAERSSVVGFRQFFATFGALAATVIGFWIFFVPTAEFRNGQLNEGGVRAVCSDAGGADDDHDLLVRVRHTRRDSVSAEGAAASTDQRDGHPASNADRPRGGDALRFVPLAVRRRADRLRDGRRRRRAEHLHLYVLLGVQPQRDRRTRARISDRRTARCAASRRRSSAASANASA